MIMIVKQKFFNQSIKDEQITCKIQNIASGQGHDHTTCCLLEYLYIK